MQALCQKNDLPIIGSLMKPKKRLIRVLYSANPTIVGKA